MPAERERMLAGELYDPEDPELSRARGQARRLCADLNRDLQTHRGSGLTRELFGRGGDSVLLQPPFFCDYGFNIELGERVYFNFNCVVLDVCRVHIGARTLIGPAVQIYTAVHPLDAMARRDREAGRPVHIGDDVWIGGGAIVLPGVRIGDRSVIGAGSVVTRDIPDDVLAAGNPCRVIRRLDAAG